MDKPDVDLIDRLSPAISIDQKTTSKNPRSTVATVTEIYDYLRLLYARVGRPICPNHGIEIKSQTVQQMVDYYELKGSGYPSDVFGGIGEAGGLGGAPTIEDFCQIYYEEAAAEGVRAEVAFAQAMHETDFLRYGNIVRVGQFNFGGLGALDGNSQGNCASFYTVREGVRAQIQHLKAYASTENLKNPCVDPRFHLVKRGNAPYVEYLGKPTSKNYGYIIVDKIKALKSM